MNSTLVQTDRKNIIQIYADVVIAGCGAAGLYTALNLDPALKCALLNKAGTDKSNSMYAQGGISAVIAEDPESLRRHFEDTVAAGAGLCDEAAVKVLVDEAGENIGRLLNLGVPFDRRGGELLRTREGGHGERRILHCGGDATGLYLTASLYQAALERRNIRFYNDFSITDIFADEKGVSGVLALDGSERPVLFSSRHVVMATGGVGRVYRASTNAVCATGDGIAAAARAGAELKDMEFVQFHPTALVEPDLTGRYFLISEAMRGEGAKLINKKGEAFMSSVHPMADLAPRDVVSRAISVELEKTGEKNVYLDITGKRREYLRERFPTIYQECMRRGIDIAGDYIPVAPVQHYFMGGIKTGLFGETSVPGLYACGEAACTGVHGANRLASNSLLECIVFGRRLALYIGGQKFHKLPSPVFEVRNGKYSADFASMAAISEIRGIMCDKCGILRNETGLSEAKERIGEINGGLKKTAIRTRINADAASTAEIALAIVTAALLRKDSIGAHCVREKEVLK